MSAAVQHLYVHVPFCAHRCGYCDFVTVTGREHLQERYVDALLAELARHRLTPRTVFVGGGTPTLLSDAALARLLAGLPPAEEVTVEANPETVTPRTAAVLAAGGVNRVSVGVQSFQPGLLRILERRASPAQSRTAVARLRDAGIANLNLDLMFGVPGQTPADLERDLEDALALAPEHISWYELEAKPGTRFTHRHGAELERQAEALEEHYETVVRALTAGGYRWYETANFCRDGRRSLHNLGYWEGRDYVGVGVGAVSTLGLERRRNRASIAAYLEAVERGEDPPCEVEILSEGERAFERLALGLRLDSPLRLGGLAELVDERAAERLAAAGLIERAPGTIALSERGRFLANDVVATLVR